VTSPFLEPAMMTGTDDSHRTRSVRQFGLIVWMPTSQLSDTTRHGASGTNSLIGVETAL
jgi:hypothetical protein